jgi:hypothetical protein
MSVTQGGRTDFNGTVSVNNFASASASACLDLTSTTQGALLPRMTTTQQNNISTPATGLTIYNSTLNQLQVYNGTSWFYAGGPKYYICANLTGISGSISAATDIVFNNVLSSNGITLNTGTGVFTLTTGKTYRMNCQLALDGNGAASLLTYTWVDTGNTALYTNTAMNAYSQSSPSSDGTSPENEIIYVCGATTTVKVRITAVAGTGLLYPSTRVNIIEL